jgi:hypothetical protein
MCGWKRRRAAGMEMPKKATQFATPVANNFGNSLVTTSTIDPGLIWVGSYFQVGLEAIIPVNRESGIGVGILGQLHLYPDDIFPIHWWRLERFC